MATSSTNGQPILPPLVDQILQSGKAAFDPDVPEEERMSNVPRFQTLLDM